MPIISGSPASSASALALLSSTTISGVAAAFDVQNIDQTYNDLVLVMAVRSSAAANQDTGKLRFNNDAATNYFRQDTQGSAAAASSNFAAGQTGVLIITPAASGTLANSFSQWEATIQDYASAHTKHVEVRSISVYDNISGATTWEATAGTWNSTAAITRVQLLPDSAPNTWVIGSTLRIYGRK